MNWANRKEQMQHNIGSTWYGDMETMLSCASKSLEAMHYLITWEFTETQRTSWTQTQEECPQWYFGVITMYSDALAINHCTKENGVQEVQPDLMDYYTTSEGSVWEHPHIHKWHFYRKYLTSLRGRTAGTKI